MTDTPRKTLSITRKPSSSGAPPTVQRSGKRIIKREELSNLQKPGKLTKPAKKPKPRKPTKPAPSLERIDQLNAFLNGFKIWRELKPLALGIDKQLFKLINDNQLSASKRVVQKLLHKHCSKRRYLRNVAAGGQRYNLDGTPAGDIIAAEQQHALRTIAKIDRDREAAGLQ